MCSDIRGADKGVGKLARAVVTDKIFLVHTRGQLNDFLWHFQKRGVETAKHGHRPFGQPGIFDDQAFIRNQRQPRGRSSRLCTVANERAAFGEMDENMGIAELFNIIACVANSDRAAVVESMSHRGRAADDAFDLAWHDIIAQYRDDALQWADPAQTFRRSRPRAPAL